MKIAPFLLPAVSAFSVAVPQARPSTSLNVAAAVVTGPKGKAAATKEEDLMLTLKIIMDHEKRSTTVSKEQFISQMEEAKDSVEETIDVSIPYDAAALLAYESSDKSMEYEQFKTKYEADAVELVKSKQPIDVSIPYDAAAKLAYESSDKSMDYAAFKTQYEADAVAMVKSKQPIDVSIPYDAAARLAYESSDKTVTYAEFKKTYHAEAVAMVKAKQNPGVDSDTSDVSIPYDAPAQLAYASSDKSVPYDKFKTKFEADAVKDVIAKRAETAAAS